MNDLVVQFSEREKGKLHGGTERAMAITDFTNLPVYVTITKNGVTFKVASVVQQENKETQIVEFIDDSDKEEFNHVEGKEHPINN